jgi:four helix bundle protein
MTDNKLTKNHELERRMIMFAVSVIKKLESINTLSPRIADQLVRSSSSIGANYAEANNASSKADFKNKIFIAKKETAETRYWIDLVIELTGDSSTWDANRQEAHELLMILQAIINTMKESIK